MQIKILLKMVANPYNLCYNIPWQKNQLFQNGGKKNEKES